MTVKATLFLGKIKPGEKETFGLKSPWEPDRLPEMKRFEDSMLDMITNIQFKNSEKEVGRFQRKLKADIKKMKSDDKIYVKGDKSNNLYKMSKTDYQKFCDQSIQKDYKRCDESEVKNIIQEEKNIACKLGVGDRMDIPSKSNK